MKKEGRLWKYFEYTQNKAVLTNALLYLLMSDIKMLPIYMYMFTNYVNIICFDIEKRAIALS